MKEAGYPGEKTELPHNIYTQYIATWAIMRVER